MSDLSEIPFNKPIRAKLKEQIRLRKTRQNEDSSQTTQQDTRPPPATPLPTTPTPATSPRTAPCPTSSTTLTPPPWEAPTTPARTTPRTNPSSMTPSQNSRTRCKKSIFKPNNKAKGSKHKKGFLEESDEDEPAVLTKQKSIVLSILRETPKSGKIKNLARSIRISKVSRIKGKGVNPNDSAAASTSPIEAAAAAVPLRRSEPGASRSSSEDSLLEPRRPAQAVQAARQVPLRQSQRLASRSSSEESLPDPRRPRVQCPHCKKWLRYTEVPIHVRDKHADLDLSNGMDGFSSSCKLSL